MDGQSQRRARGLIPWGLAFLRSPQKCSRGGVPIRVLVAAIAVLGLTGAGNAPNDINKEMTQLEGEWSMLSFPGFSHTEQASRAEISPLPVASRESLRLLRGWP